MMFYNIFSSLSLLAATFLVSSVRAVAVSDLSSLPLNERSYPILPPQCAAVVEIVDLLHLYKAATPFCSAFLHIPCSTSTSTATVTKTITDQKTVTPTTTVTKTDVEVVATATVDKVSTIFSTALETATSTETTVTDYTSTEVIGAIITTTVTSFTSIVTDVSTTTGAATQTSFITTPGPDQVAPTFRKRGAIPAYLDHYATGAISRACSCLSIKPSVVVDHTKTVTVDRTITQTKTAARDATKTQRLAVPETTTDTLLSTTFVTVTTVITTVPATATDDELSISTSTSLSTVVDVSTVVSTTTVAVAPATTDVVYYYCNVLGGETADGGNQYYAFQPVFAFNSALDCYNFCLTTSGCLSILFNGLACQGYTLQVGNGDAVMVGAEYSFDNSVLYDIQCPPPDS